MEHFHEMFDADIRFLFIMGRLDGWVTACCLLLLQSKELLLLLDAYLIALFQGELRVLAVNTLCIYGRPRLFYLSQHFQ